MARRRLEVDIIVDERGASRAFGTIGRDVDTLGSRMRSAGAVGARALGAGVVAAGAAAAYGIKKSVDAARESNRVGRQTEAVIKSTGAAANVTAEEVANYTSQLSLKTGVDDEAIQSGANLLLTFKDIRNEAGEGNKIFNETVAVSTDMAAALGQDVSQAAMTAGKALNDPAEGLSRLTRVGVLFTEKQKERIEGLVEEGHKLKAQKIILQELRSEFGGSAAAQSDAVDDLAVAFENAEESIGNIFMPVIDDASEQLTKKFLPRIQRAGEELSAIAARDDIDWGDKLNLAGPVLEREFGDVPGMVDGFIDEALPVIASRAGEMGVTMFKGMIEGFADSDLAGKAALGVLSFGTIGPLLGGLGDMLGTGVERESKKGVSRGLRRGMRFGVAGALAGGAGALMGGVGGGGALEGAIAGGAIGSIAGPWGVAIGMAVGAAAAETIGPSMAENMANEASIDVKGMIDEGVVNKDVGRLRRVRRGLGDVRQALVETGASAEELAPIDDRLEDIDKALDGMRAPRRAFRGAIDSLREGAVVTLPQIEKVVRRNSRRISQGWTAGSAEARENTARNYRAAAAAIQKGMDQGLIHTREGLRRQRQLLRNARLVEGSDPVGIAEGFSRSWKLAGKISGDNVDQILKDLRKMPPGARDEAARTMIDMAQKLQSNGNLPKRAVARLRSALVAEFGNIREGMVDKTREGLDRVGSLFDGLVGRTAGALNTLGGNFAEVAGALGVKDIPSWSLDYSARPRARGGRLDHPVIIAGEEAPAHPEWVIATNPAYRHKNVEYWYQAGHDLGIPGFREGGQLADAHLRGGTRPLRAAGQYVLSRSDAAAEAWLARHGTRTVDSYIKEGDRMDALHRSYLWGGGHGAMPSRNGPWDCSGGTSQNLYGAGWKEVRPMVSGNFASWGLPGKGPISIYANSEHVYSVVEGRGAIGTSGENPGGGYGWISGYTSRPGFTIRHAPMGAEALSPNAKSASAKAVGGSGNKGQKQLKGFRKGGNAGGPSRKPYNRNINHAWPWDSTDALPPFVVGALAEWAGLPGRAFMQIALGESGYQPGAVGYDSGGTIGLGLWQVTTHYNDDIIAKYGGRKEMLNPVKNAKAAKEIYDRQGIGAWYGTSHLTDPNAHWDGRFDIQHALGGAGGGGGGGNPIPDVDPAVGDATMIQGIGRGTVADVMESIGGNRGRNVGSRPGRPAPLPAGAENLPANIQRLLRSPGLTYAQQTSILDLGLAQAGRTASTDDDRTLLTFERDLVTGHRDGVADEIRRINRRLRQGGLNAAERKRLVSRRSTLLDQLGSDTSTLTSIGDQLESLSGSEEVSSLTEELKALREALEENTNVAREELATGLVEAKRALADMISGELGPKTFLQAQTAGDGMVGAGAARRY